MPYVIGYSPPKDKAIGLRYYFYCVASLEAANRLVDRLKKEFGYECYIGEAATEADAEEKIQLAQSFKKVLPQLHQFLSRFRQRCEEWEAQPEPDPAKVLVCCGEFNRLAALAVEPVASNTTAHPPVSDAFLAFVCNQTKSAIKHAKLVEGFDSLIPDLICAAKAWFIDSTPLEQFSVSVGQRHWRDVELLEARKAVAGISAEAARRAIPGPASAPDNGGNCGVPAKFGESHLYPPLFIVEPQTSFADAWEVFCCEVINRHNETTEIYRRKAPESGIDLYWQSKQIAYQCKSVEDATSRFSVSKALKSLESAMKIRDSLRWNRYVFCTNVALTGPQEMQLRTILQEVEFLTPSFWVPRITEQLPHLRDRFRQLI